MIYKVTDDKEVMAAAEVQGLKVIPIGDPHKNPRCHHENTTPHYDYVQCDDCFWVLQGKAHNEGGGGRVWWESIEHAEFFYKHGRHMESYAAVEVPAEKPKIKMTKTLPSECGWYFYTLIEGMLPVTVFVDDQLQREGNMINGRAQMIDVGDIGGYWAKVEQDQFEFEG